MQNSECRMQAEHGIQSLHSEFCILNSSDSE
jgi:hypothetical protein